MRVFSTFDIIKGLRLNRNTFQSSLSAGYIKPDIKTARRKGERSEFSLEAFYNINLYFHLLRAGMPRPKAALEANISWENIGPEPRQKKYLNIKLNTMPDHNNLKGAGENPITSEPPTLVNDDKTMITVINLLKLKQQVDKVVEGLK